MTSKLPNLLDHLDHVFAVLRSGRVGLITDFDGTIAAIASTPDGAMISDRAARSLEHLAGRLALVCVISGRAAKELQGKAGLDGVLYVGNHGVEYLDGGRLHVEPWAAEYRDKISRVVDHLRAAVDCPALGWDDKYYSTSVHYRLAADPAQARNALASALQSAPGAGELDVFWGKMVMEICAPLGLDKGYAVRKLTRERRLDGAIVLGDDTTDLDALAALKELRAQGTLTGVGVAVLHDDSPDELAEVADYSLDGVPEVEDLLARLEQAT